MDPDKPLEGARLMVLQVLGLEGLKKLGSAWPGFLAM